MPVRLVDHLANYKATTRRGGNLSRTRVRLVCILCKHPVAAAIYWRNHPETATRLAAADERFAITGSWLPDLPEPRRSR
jgi:hypothetical protein